MRRSAARRKGSIVDDDPGVCALLDRGLARRGFEAAALPRHGMSDIEKADFRAHWKGLAAAYPDAALAARLAPYGLKAADLA